jgi:PAS domain S-box-containing protein
MEQRAIVANSSEFGVAPGMNGKTRKNNGESRSRSGERSRTGSGRTAKTPAGAVTATAGFIVDEDLNIREFVGHTAPFVTIPSGEASLSLLRVLSPQLRPAVIRALDTAEGTTSGKEKTRRLKGPTVSISGRLRQVDVEVAPAKQKGSPGLRRRVLFRYRETPARVSRPGVEDRLENAIAGRRLKRLRGEFQSLLEQEKKRHSSLMSRLKESRGEARLVQEQLEISYTELEAANSELRAMLAEREEIEEQLRESEAASRVLLETAAQAIIAVDSQERIVRVNEMACKMFGYSREELLDRKLGILLPRGLRGAHSGHVAGYFRKPLSRPMGSGRELTGLRKDGSRFPIEVGLSSVRLDHISLVVAFVSDISSRKANEEEIAATGARLRQLGQKLTTATEAENRRWARELHDVYSQRLVGIAMALSRMAGEQGSDPQLGALEEQVRTLATDIHRLSRRMHPNILHDLGLVAALRAEADSFGRDSGIVVKFQAEDVPVKLNDDVALCLYRVAQEALRNIRKHSGATRVGISLTGRGGGLVLIIRDRGDGFQLGPALRKGGLGLVSMEERVLAVGGDFSIDSAPRKGTTVKVVVPLKGP